MARLSGNALKTPVVFVAESDLAEIVGFVSGGPEKMGGFDAEVYALYVMQSYQGQKLGQRLLRAIAQRLAGEGYETLLIWVNALNPAGGFYQLLGGKAVRTGQREIKGVTYDDIGYGWNKAAFQRLLQEIT